MWMKGSAGVGKSALAQTLAERRAADGSLLATFFFYRFDPSRDNINCLVATIAYQVSINIPELQDFINEELRRDPLILRRSIQTQFRTLIIRPLERLTASTSSTLLNSARLIIIDGLDECLDVEAQTHLVEIILDVLQSTAIPIKFLVSSRPEWHLEAAFSNYDKKLLFHLDLDKVFCNDDILIFFQDKFEEIRRSHPSRATLPPDWPNPDILSTLVRNASGQFVYAATVMKYVGSTRRPPPISRLQTVLGMREYKPGVSPPIYILQPTYREPNKQFEAPFATLDTLYSTILSAAGDDAGVLLDILCLGFNYPDMDSWFPDVFLSLEEGETQLMIGQLASVLTIQEIRKPWIQATHASFGEFLRDVSRSKEYFLDAPQRHTRLAIRCLEILKHPDQFASVNGYRESQLYKYAHNYLPDHLRHGELTGELSNSIAELSILEIFNDTRLQPQPNDFIRFIVGYIESIKTLDQGIHASVMKAFREYVLPSLDQYYSNEGLTFAIAMMYIICEQKPKLMGSPTGGWLANATPDILGIDEASLRLLYASRRGSDRWSVAYMNLIHDLLRDPDVESKYRMDAKRFATSTMFALELAFVKENLDNDSGAGRTMNQHILPYLLEKAEWSQEVGDFFKRYPERLEAIAKYSKVTDVIARYR
ncbi:hypothetical protein CVT26_005525 [Gymnopilus dilepis]|uniref:NACHT domain-containing protein n=1 Tax=Gymnopilus dilepis TaxID=231916 RepID=A0A409W861_9AGAR|nr:hypothetical protein CVT26_005525 [Gymnopilus dilepis]